MGDRSVEPTAAWPFGSQELLARLQPAQLFPEVATALEGLLPADLPRASFPIDIHGLVRDIATLLRRSGRLAAGEKIEVLDLQDLSVISQIPALRAAIEAQGTTAQVITDNATQAGAQATTTATNPQPALMGIYLCWRDLDENLWPSSLQAIPQILRMALQYVFGLIQAFSQGNIRGLVFSAIQPAMDDGATVAVHIDLVLPSFIVEIFGADPEYPEAVEVKGRSFMLGLPVAGRPIIKPPMVRHPSAPPGSPLVPLGRPLTAQSLLTSDGWKKFVDEVKTMFKTLGVDLAQTILKEVAKAFIEHAVSAAADFMSKDGLNPTLQKMGETFRSALEATGVTDLASWAANTAVGDFLITVAKEGWNVIHHFIDFLEQVVLWAQTTGSTLALGIPGAAFGPLTPLVEVVTQVVEEMVKGEVNQFGDLVMRPLYETMFGDWLGSLNGQIGKGLFKELEGVRRIGFLTQVKAPKAPAHARPAGCRVNGAVYQSSTAFVIDDVELDDRGNPKSKGKDYANGQHVADAGTVLAFRILGGDEYREIDRLEDVTWTEGTKTKRETYVHLKASSSLQGVGGGAIGTVMVGTPVLAATDFMEGMDPDYLNLAMIYHAALERAQEWAEKQVSKRIDEMFKGVREGLNEDKPTVFTAKIENQVETVMRDFLADLVGGTSFAELDSGMRERVLRAIPVGALGGGKIELDVAAQVAVWTIPGGAFSSTDVGKTLDVANAAQPSNNGQFVIVEVRGDDRVTTDPGLLVVGDLGPNTIINVVEYIKRESDELLFGFTMDDLRKKGIEAVEKFTNKLLLKGFEKATSSLVEKVTEKVTGNKMDLDDFNKYLQQNFSYYGGWNGRGFADTIKYHVGHYTQIFCNEIKVADFLDFKSVFTNFGQKASQDQIPDASGNLQPNPVYHAPAEIASDVAASAVVELIGRAFIVSVVLGFELTGGQAKEGGGVLVDWAAGLFLFNKIHGNRAEGSGDGGGVFVRGYLPNVFMFNEIEKNVAIEEGGGVYLDSSLTAWILNTIYKNEAELGGGVFVEKKAISLWVFNELEQNKAKNGGGLVSDARMTVWLGNDIEENEAQEQGGGALFRRKGSFFWNKFARNRADWGGGYACVERARVNLTGNNVKGNTARLGGGGIAVLGPGARPDIAADRIHGNTAPKGGGIFVDETGRPELDMTRISSNVADEDGGGIYVAPGPIGMPKPAGARIFGNRAQRGGGAWFGRPSGLFGCDVAANTGYRMGGGLYVENVEAFHLNGTAFSGNVADQVGGGAALFRTGAAWVHGSRFEDNKVFRRDGAGIYAEECPTFTVESSQLERNFVDAGGNGGGIAALRCASARLERSQLEKNGTEHYRGATAGITSVDQCAGGGAWFRACGSVNVDRVRLAANGAERGGGVAFIDCAEVVVTRSELTGNCADQNFDGFGLGGAIFGTGARSTILIGGVVDDANTFAGNTAGTPPGLRQGMLASPEAHGGAIAIDAGPRAVVNGNTFHHNAAWDLGGAVFFRDTALGSMIGGENDVPPPRDPQGGGRKHGNRGAESCAVEIIGWFPFESGQPGATVVDLDEQDRPVIGTRRLILGVPEPGLVGNAIREARDKGGIFAQLLLGELDRLKQPLYQNWPALQSSTSAWDDPVPGTGLIPPWPPPAGWMPAHPFRTHQWKYTDATPVYSAGVQPDRVREIVTRRGGLIALVRGGGTAVVGNWLDKSYAVQMGGAVYVLESDANTVVGIAPGAPESHANLFRTNVSSLGGALALEKTACLVSRNVFGGAGEVYEANVASGGGAILVHESTATVAANRVVGNLAGHTISAKDADRFPDELARWAGRGLLAFGGGIAVTGGARTGRGPRLLENEIRGNEILAIPDYAPFPLVAPSSPAAPPSTPAARPTPTPTPTPTPAPATTTTRSVRPILAPFAINLNVPSFRLKLASIRGILARLHPPAGSVPPPAVVTAAPRLALPDGDFLFGAGVALLETDVVDLSDNFIGDNRVTAGEATLARPLHLVGGGVAALLVDATPGLAARLTGPLIANRVEVAHGGVDPAQIVVLAGGGIAVLATRRFRADGCKMERNLVGRDLPSADDPTDPLRGALRGGAVALLRGEEIAVSASRLHRNALLELDEGVSAAGGGVFVEDVTDLLLEGIEITRNWSHRDGGGLALAGHNEGALVACTIADNECPSRGDALFVDGDASAVAAKVNLLRAFPGHNGAALFVADGALPPRLGDEAIDAVTGPAVRAAAPLSGWRALRSGFADGDGNDYRVTPGAPAAAGPGGRPYGATAIGGTTRPYNVIQVPQDSSTIAGALAAAVAGDTVVVAPGTYQEVNLKVPDEVALVSVAGADETFLVPPVGTPKDTPMMVLDGERKGTCVAGFTLRGRVPTVPPTPATTPVVPTLIGVICRGSFRGTLVDLVVEDCKTGVRVQPITPGGRELLDRAVFANLTVLRCETGIHFEAERVVVSRPPREEPCRAPRPPLDAVRQLDFADPILHHEIVSECDTALVADRPAGTPQPPVTSRFVARIDVDSGAVVGFVGDLLTINDNTRDDPFLLPPPKPHEHHPTEATGSRVLGDAWPDDRRTFGALEPMAAPVPPTP